MSAEPDADPRQLMAQLEMVQRQMQRVDRRLSALEQAMAETQQALGAVRHLAESSGVQEVLLPIGAGVSVRARVDASARVVTPIGAGYATEGPAAEVAQALEERSRSIVQGFEQASAEAQELAMAHAALTQQLESISPSS
jgi:prefoldin alpha subunit